MKPTPLKLNTSISRNELEESITELAKELATCAPRRTSFTIPARLKQFMDFFQECYEYFEEATKAQGFHIADRGMAAG